MFLHCTELYTHHVTHILVNTLCTQTYFACALTIELGTHHVADIFLHVLELHRVRVVQLIREHLVTHAQGTTIRYWGK